ncbi:hypothetical protein [Bacillus sp. Marseille-Q3570]|uniref:hypothetical protein n=1 Tax=Bacillus sp. Marseille-Q3570 TaxID=2963522 RepID=UPI0021B82635|nr:hypothetical protein [Bacillus sp. Marseille-Q3570]
MILGYVLPLLLVFFFFLSAYFLMSGLAKIILMAFLGYLMIFPYILLYKQEVKEYKEDTNKILNEEESGA